MIRRRDLILRGGAAAAALTLFARGPAAQGAAPAAGKIDKLRGTATGLLAGRRRQLHEDAEVFVRERLQTGPQSRLHALLGPATRLSMGENTIVTIDDHLLTRGGTIHLSAGGLLFQRQAPDPKPDVTIRSPFGLLAVRGTTVFAGPSNGVFGVFLVDGEVEAVNAGARVVLRAGEGTDIAAPDARPTAAARWGQGRIESALRSVR